MYVTSPAEQHGNPARLSTAITPPKLEAFELLPMEYAHGATGSGGNSNCAQCSVGKGGGSTLLNRLSAVSIL